MNEVVCHGIPGPRALRDGDIINVDVTTTVCSNCADNDPSAVRTVHLSFGSTSTSQPPTFTIGSMVNVMPARMRSPVPRLP
ncbi:MAG TPA: hypothetical protein VK762_10640 [Polyangiaceae bacterium]|nr:hypothetical protein [Polyangiaceae bacterium]